MLKHIYDPDDYYILTEAFKAFGPDTGGLIDAGRLRQALREGGMAEYEVNVFFEFSGFEENKINFEDYIFNFNVQMDNSINKIFKK